MPSPRDELLRPGGVLASVRRFWWLPVGLALIGAVVMAGLSVTSTRVVPAEGQVILAAVHPPSLERTNAAQQAIRRVADESLRMTSNGVLQRASATTGLDMDELRRSVRARPAELSTAVVVAGRAGTAEESVRRVDAVIDAYVEEVRETRARRTDELFAAIDRLITNETDREEQLETELETIEAELDAIAADQSSTTSEREAVLRQLMNSSTARAGAITELRQSEREIADWVRRKTELAAELDLFDNGVDLIRRPNGPSGPAEPNTTRNVLLAIALGTIVGTAAAWSLNDVGDGSMAGTAAPLTSQQQDEPKHWNQRLNTPEPASWPASASETRGPSPSAVRPRPPRALARSETE